jgi:hypothetical protein
MPAWLKINIHNNVDDAAPVGLDLERVVADLHIHLRVSTGTPTKLRQPRAPVGISLRRSGGFASSTRASTRTELVDP